MKGVISFDLDGTISDGLFSEHVWLEGIPCEFSKVHEISFEEAKKHVINAYNDLSDKSLAWYDIYFWLERFDLKIDPYDLLRKYKDFVRFLPYAREILEELRGKYKLILASNATRIFVEWESRILGLSSYFDIIISATSDYNMVKDERFYKKLSEDLSVSCENMVHVGDHPFFDFLSPSSCGIRAFLVNPRREDSLKSLRDILGYL